MKKNVRIAALILILILISTLVFFGCDPKPDDDPDKENPTVGDRTLDLYAINDFHGEVNKIAQTAGFLSEKKNENKNTVILNSGDMFQGSMESNSNYGKLLSDCMDATPFDSFTYGNHEFDWGIENLIKLSGESKTPFLGANIYHWDRESGFGKFASEFAKEYTVAVLENGLKVGIIGVIGESQITSISSNMVQSIGFKEPLPIIKSLAQKLRGEEKCDVVVVSAHASAGSLLSVDPNSEDAIENYVDAVFCAHTHKNEIEHSAGVPFVQGGSNGKYVSHIRLEVKADKTVSAQTAENIEFSSEWPNKLVVGEYVDNSNAKIKEEAERVLAVLDGKFDRFGLSPRIVCRAMADYAVSRQFDVHLAIANQGRKNLDAGEITYADLYENIPFDNLVYIAKVKGSNIISQAKINSIWRVKGEAIDPNEWYTVAVLDYLLFHQNSQREYDYYPTAFESGFTPVPLTKEGYYAYNYRYITRDWLLKNSNVKTAEFKSNNTNAALLESGITLDY